MSVEILGYLPIILYLGRPFGANNITRGWYPRPLSAVTFYFMFSTGFLQNETIGHSELIFHKNASFAPGLRIAASLK